ncbi:MAG: hypothetical protein HUJ29_06335 [Gammaproteobacteria bacterium]|nr:hypothetical protein [Gammaproteobacteria bacterium]
MVRLISFITLFSVFSVQAATPQSSVGGTGIGYMRTAQVMQEDESVWFLNMGSDIFASTASPGTNASLTHAQLGYAASIGGHTELGVSAPYMLYSPDAAGATVYSGTRDVRGYFKHSLTYPGKQDGFGAAISAYATIFPGNPANNVTSGQPQYGAELNISHWTRHTAIHLNIGSENTDVWDEAATPPFSADRLLKFGLGIEVGLSKAMGFTVQAVATQSPANLQEHVLLGTVFQYMPSPRWAFTLGAGMGTPSGTNQASTSLILGVTYSGNSQYQSRYELAADYVDYHRLSLELQEEVKTLSQRVEALELKLDQTELRVEKTEKNFEVYKYDYSTEY